MFPAFLGNIQADPGFQTIYETKDVLVLGK
jgi:hypothetical protein